VQRGAALLLAMVGVTLIVALAGAMVWQQHRSIEVEAAERARGQAGWMLLGALDWSRLILREDARSGTIDHGGEPWATPLAEARLSTFLAAEKGIANVDDEGPEAFLSGSITDAQARYNLRNLVNAEGKLVDVELATLRRLCAAAGLPVDTANQLASRLLAAWTDQPTPAGSPRDDHALPVKRFEQLAWLGFEPDTLKALRNSADILPTATPININTAPREVLAAVLDVDMGVAERLVQRRQRAPFELVERLKPLLPADTKIEPQRVAVMTNHFEVRGRLRLKERVLEERSLVLRRGSGNGTEVVTLHRERLSLQLAP
jgi:general secretion pathway protein K